MSRIKDFIKKLTKIQKFCCLILILIFFLMVFVVSPSLAKYKNRTTIYTATTWDGTIATKYKTGDGTANNPYIISNGQEFAYFKEQLKVTNYANTYFKLSGDIVLNDGVFDYNSTEGALYILNNVTYYLDVKTGEYYDNYEKNNSSVGKINKFESLNKFKGNLNGNSFAIFGLFISNEDNTSTGLFKELEGVIENLSVENSFVLGANNTAGIVGVAINSTINSVLYDGFVIENGQDEQLINSIDPISITASNEEVTTTIEIGSTPMENISSIVLTGDYVISDDSSETQIKINNNTLSNGHFEINLGNTVQNEIYITASSNIENTKINFTNLKYTINYNNSITSGIVSETSNTSINNTINKAKIYGNYISSGIVGKVNNTLKIENSYNTGEIYGNNIASGIVGVIDNNQNYVELNKVYNSGEIISQISSGILSRAQNNVGIINVSNSFNTTNNYSINSVSNSVVNITNCYNTNNLSIYSGTLSNDFISTDIENLKNKEYLNTNLGFNSYIDFKDLKDNINNVWVLKNGSLPTLYIDEVQNPTASINITKHSWKNYSDQLNVINLSSNITFSIEELSNIDPIKEKYYYISNNKIALTEEELNNITDWTKYENVVEIKSSGYYVVYAKIIKYNDEIEYINSDILALDSDTFDVELTLNNKVWKTKRATLDEIYINKPEYLTVVANYGSIGIQNIEYLVSTAKLTDDELSTSVWSSYEDVIEITEPGKYIVYVKVTNNDLQTKYINSDYIVFDGYEQNLYIGKNNNQYNSLYITPNSSLKLEFSSNVDLEFKEGYEHVFSSNIKLPVNTKITLIDKNINKIYNFVVENENTNVYSFDKFKEIGMSTDNYYDESVNYNKTYNTQNYTIIVDFKNVVEVQNYTDVTFELAIRKQNEYIYQTLDTSLKTFNICIDNVELKDKLYLTSDYTNQQINYNSDSQTNINLVSGINFSTINDIEIIDTTLENYNMGLQIKVLDSNGNIVSKDKLNNMIIKLDDIDYKFNDENMIKVNLGNSRQVTKNLQIITAEGNNTLSAGTYYIQLANYISEDGYNFTNVNSNYISIPVVVNSENEIINQKFVLENIDDSEIVNFKETTQTMTYKILEPSNIENLNVRVSLYEKEQLTAFDQSYKLVDLKDYINNSLTLISNKTYLIDASSQNIELQLIPNKFNKTGYKYVFELYDGDTRIDQISKYFIVR